jgi:hypothetical protein
MFNVDFTREPIIETIITPKDGYKLVVRSSKSAGQEEYFVDAVEVVSFGQGLFFRSAERPKAFLVPLSDYEVLEVREARMVLKNIGPDRSIKIGGGRETPAPKPQREPVRLEAPVAEEAEPAGEAEHGATAESVEGRTDPRLDKKRDRRRHSRKRKGREEGEVSTEEGTAPANIPTLEDDKINIPAPEEGFEAQEGTSTLSPSVLSSLLQPPPTLISETINRYRENALFKSAFFMTEEEQYKPHDKVQELLSEDDEVDFVQPLKEPAFSEEEAGLTVDSHPSDEADSSQESSSEEDSSQEFSQTENDEPPFEDHSEGSFGEGNKKEPTPEPIKE